MKLKNVIYATFLTISLIQISCKRCGENVSLGDYNIENESIVNWFPYLDKTELVFENSVGQTLSLNRTIIEEEMVYQPFREICRESSIDNAEEYYKKEWIKYVYSKVENGTTYSIEVLLYVDHLMNQTSLFLFDKVEFSSYVTNTQQSVAIGGSVQLVASKRGNNINDSYFYFLSTNSFAEEMVINGEAYQNVWYFNRDGTPSIYVQMGKGVIGFLGINDEIWVLSETH